MPEWWKWKSTKSKDQQNQDKSLKDNSIFSKSYQTLSSKSSLHNIKNEKKQNKSFDDAVSARASPRSSYTAPSASPSRFSGFDSDRIGHPLPQPSISPTTSVLMADLQVYALGSGSVSSSGDSSVSSADNLDHGQLGIFRGHGEAKFSPQLKSPGRGSRAPTTTTSPLHPRFVGSNLDSPNKRLDDGKSEGHRLPLPPSSPTSPGTGTGTRVCSSPNRPSVVGSNVKNGGVIEGSNCQLSKWKKGRLLGRGTFGHVYLGFNSESGQMCAIKEVKVVADDQSSKESLKQLNQEITLLSQLIHPNIVQYHGSEMGEETLSVYLEYVSGGSIHKLLQEYGPFREPVIQNYTRQVLCGLRSERVGFTGPLRSERNTQRQEREPMVRGTTGHYNHQNEHLMKSGPLGMCDDPYCTTCPAAYKARLMSRNSRYHLDDVWYRGAKMRVKEKLWLIKNFLFGVMNPHAKAVQQWNQFLVISCLFAIFIDPLFFYLLSVNKECKCIMINWPMTKTIVIFRSMTDLIYLLHILVQFRLAFVSPESRVVGAGDLVDHPRKIALHYLSGFFFLDLFIVLPIPEIIVLLMLPHATTSSGATYAKNLLGAGVLVQYIPRLYRFLPLFVGQSPSGFIFESAWANFVINLLTFFLAGHVVGSSWYMLGLQRVNECLRKACKKSPGIFPNCLKFIDCGRGDDFLAFEVDKQWNNWKQNAKMNACFSENGFPYGIYQNAVNLILEENIITRYVYSFFWGFQQISTLAGNQTPSYKVWEVLFTMGIIGLGLLLFALLIGNMQNFLQGLGRRRLEMSLRGRDIEHWMGHRHLPEDLRRKVRESEHYNWAATRGVNEEMLMENFPDDLQRDVRRHLFMFVKKVRIFSMMKEPILDAICERLRQKTYIEGGTPLYQGGVVTNMVFIVRGKMESIGENGNHVPLSEGDVFGEELLRWSPENGDTRNDRNQGCRWLSSRTVTCLTNVEAFVLRAADLEEVTTLFAEFLNDRHVQFSIRNQSPYWRGIAATTIQLAWRYYKKRQNRAKTTRGRGPPPSRWPNLPTLLQR